MITKSKCITCGDGNIDLEYISIRVAGKNSNPIVFCPNCARHVNHSLTDYVNQPFDDEILLEMSIVHSGKIVSFNKDEAMNLIKAIKEDKIPYVSINYNKE